MGGIRKHGVCLYIRQDVKFVTLEEGCVNVCCVHLFEMDLFVAVVYRPPSSNHDENVALLSFLNSFCDSREVLIVGDFNLPYVPWDDDLMLAANLPPLQRGFVDCFSSLGLTQWVLSPTFVFSDNILDLVLTSEEDRLGDVTVHPTLPGCGHSPLTFCYHFMRPLAPNISGSVRRAWHRGNYGLIEESVAGVDWSYEFSELSLSEMLSRFGCIIGPLIDLHIPVHDPKSQGARFRPPGELVRARKSSWTNYKNVRSRYGRRSGEAAVALADFQQHNLLFRRFFNDAVVSYEQSLAANLKENCKLFHKYVRSKKVGNPSVGPLRSEGCLVSDFAGMAEVLAGSFSSVYSARQTFDPVHSRMLAFDVALISSVPISIDAVRSVLSSLDVNSSMGPDGIHPCLLKYCPGMAEPLYLIFKRSLDVGVVPSLWKFSEIIPLFKKGSRSDPLNYRPISLTSVCCKSLERIVVSCLVDFLESNFLLSSDQFGFRRGMAVEDQLIVVYDDITSWLDSGHVVDIVLFDFSKAFDVVPHSVLMGKLSLLGVSGCLYEWIGSFLSNRSMHVSVSGSHSSPRQVLSGVPQGSVLGPVLFLVFVNSLPSFVQNKTKMFADDMKLYLKVRRGDAAQLTEDLSSCQADIDELRRVATSWGLDFNVGKCVTMRFGGGRSDLLRVGHPLFYSLDDHELARQNSTRDLGVVIDSSLRFHAHVRQIVAKAWGLANNLLRSTLCRSGSFMCNIYIAHIRPLLEYSSPVWNTGFVGDSKLLESVQRRWTKHVEGVGDLEYPLRLRSLGLYSVKGRLLRADLIKYFKIFSGLSVIKPSDLFVLSPAIGTRGHCFKILKPHVSLESRRRFFSVRCVDIWNSLPAELVICGTVNRFKSGLHDVLGDLLFEFDG